MPGLQKQPASPRQSPSPRIQRAYSIPVALGQDGFAKVEIRVSTRRRKTSQAHLEAGKVVVVVPVGLSAAQQEDVATRLARRMLNSSRRPRSDKELEWRAADLADRYLGGVRPTSVRFVTNQARRWGSCTPATGAIRISSRLQSMPEWVLDAVLVHELAHLLEDSHSRDFKELCARYPRQAEADAYLLGFEHGATTGPMPLGPLPAEGWQWDTPGEDAAGRLTSDQLSFG
jgi:predicted metal-dependent hydrolase